MKHTIEDVVGWRGNLQLRVLLLVFMALLPAFGLLVWAAHVDREARLHESENMAEQIATRAADEFAQLVDITREVMLRMSDDPLVSESSDPAACGRVLAAVRAQHPAYGLIGIIGSDGKTVCSDLEEGVGVDLADRKYFQEVLRTGNFVVSPFLMGRTSGQRRMVLAGPLHLKGGEVREVMFLSLDLNWIDREMESALMPSDANLLLLDGTGTIVAAYPERPAAIGRAVAESQSIVAFKGSGRLPGQLVTGIDGVQRMVVSVPLPRTSPGSAYVRAGVPTTAIVAASNKALRRNLLVLGAVTLLVLALGRWFANLLLVRPTQRLIATAEALGSGDLTARTRLRHDNGELGQLARHFDDMAARLQRLGRALRTLSATNRNLLRAQDEASLLEEMCRVAVDEGDYWVVWVGLLRPSGAGRLSTAAVAAAPGSHGDLRVWVEAHAGIGEEGVASRALHTGNVQVVRDVGYAPPALAGSGWPTVFAGCALPLKVRGEVIGVLKLYADDIAAFDAAEMELLEEMAADLGFGIQTLRDRRQHEIAEEKIRQMAYVDALTGLPTRLQLELECAELLETMAWSRKSLAVLALRLDGFARIQNAVGFSESEHLIVQVSQRLRGAVPAEWTVARLVGDRFAILAPSASGHDAMALARDLVTAFEQPFSVAGIDVEVNARTGVAVYPDHGADPAMLIRHADLACLDGQARGLDVCLYSGASESEDPARLQLMVDLRRAIEEGQLSVHYQGKVDAFTGAVTGAEALLRWQHPVRGNIPPVEFIPAAEETGLIKRLTSWVLDEVLRQQHAWVQEGRAVPVAVNLSGRNFRDAGLIDELQHLLHKWQVDPRLLQVEITETVLMNDAEGAQGVLARMRAMGLVILIDDFGTGYSSLRYLASLPVDVIKIDRSFVVTMTDRAEMRALVAAMIDMGHKLGLKLVAEGVDDEAQASLLRDMACDEIQGFMYCRPMPGAAFQQWLAARREAVSGDAH